MPRRKPPTIPDEVLDRLLSGSDPRAALAEGGLLDGLKKALAERVLNAEMDHHLDAGEPDGRANGRIRRSAICDSDGKRLLTPGQRLGAVAVNPAAPGREAVRGAMGCGQMATGRNVPGAPMQDAIGDPETLVIDLAAPARRRDLRCARPWAAVAHRVRRDGGGGAAPLRPRRGGAARAA